MPKIVDVAQRHTLIAEAAWRVLVRDGPTDLSVRKVAAEAGLSPSSLRHAFATQASVRDHAVALLLERLSARVNKVEGPNAMLLELLPLDDERRVEMEVSLSFGTMAMTDEALNRSHKEIHRAVRDICARAIDLLDIDPAELDGLHAFIDGLALHLVRQTPGNDTTWALSALAAQIERLQA